MSIIYTPSGRAGEYAQLAANLYRGCGHACIDCYAPSVLKMPRAEFALVRPREKALAQLERDAKKLAGDPRPVMLSFTTDPYQPAELLWSLTRHAIEILIENRLTPCILTKGGMRAARDWDVLAEGIPQVAPWFGQTLTFLNHQTSREWEPWAALPLERFTAATEAKSQGLFTWASMEPVRQPRVSLEIIRKTLDYGRIDHYKLGAWNYRQEAQEIDWAAYYHRAVEMLEGAGFRRILQPGAFEPETYFVKHDLLERAGVDHPLVAAIAAELRLG